MAIEENFVSEERIVSSRTLGEDSEIEYSLRPKTPTEYILQSYHRLPRPFPSIEPEKNRDKCFGCGYDPLH